MRVKIMYNNKTHYTRDRIDDPDIVEALERIRYEQEHYGWSCYSVSVAEEEPMREIIWYQSLNGNIHETRLAALQSDYTWSVREIEIILTAIQPPRGDVSTVKRAADQLCHVMDMLQDLTPILQQIEVELSTAGISLPGWARGKEGVE